LPCVSHKLTPCTYRCVRTSVLAVPALYLIVWLHVLGGFLTTNSRLITPAGCRPIIDCAHTHIHTYTYTRTQTQINTHIHRYILKHTLTHTSTHKHPSHRPAALVHPLHAPWSRLAGRHSVFYPAVHEAPLPVLWPCVFCAHLEALVCWRARCGQQQRS